MAPLAQAIGDALLTRHQKFCSGIDTPPGKITPAMIKGCTIAYLPLCEAAGESRMVKIVGELLDEIAEWCVSNDSPPINALAVFGKTGRPSSGYLKAPGCKDWDKEVRLCIAYKKYPDSMLTPQTAPSKKSPSGEDSSAFEQDLQRLAEAVLQEEPIIGRELVGLIKSKSPVTATRLILNKPRPTGGFKTLVSTGRADLTLEALALRHPAFFTPRQIWVAKTRLATSELRKPVQVRR